MKIIDFFKGELPKMIDWTKQLLKRVVSFNNYWK